ncbi:MAG: hypothetical protein E7329_03005 [Clostridiales bacterium]|nr:hypothetical protein [Clostridiales bacterium]
MYLWHQLLNKIRKASTNAQPLEAEKSELSPASPATQLHPTTALMAPLSADQLSSALETWRQQHDFIQAKINEEWDRTQDQLDQRQQAYLRTLHPFLRYYVPLQSFDRAVIKTDEFCVSGEEMRKMSLSYFVALDYFRNLMKQPTPDVIAYLNKSKAEMSHEDWALVERYQPDAALIVKKAVAAHEHFHRRIPDNFRWEITQKEVDTYWKQYGSSNLKYQAAYELARHGQADDFLPAPFRFLGYMGPDWDQGGMTFAIDRNCFADPDPLLCYWESEMPEIDWAQAQEEPYVLTEDAYEYQQQILEQFRSLSSGIVPLRIQGHFFFRLDVHAIKASFPHFGEDLPTAELSPYLFVKCGNRDFQAHFGQVVDGQIVQLYLRSI